MGLRLCSLLIALVALAACSSGSSSAPATASAAAAAALVVTPNPGSVAPNGTLSVSPTGGTPPYTFTVLNGIGTVSPSTGYYTVYTGPASASSTPGEVQITDSAGNTLYYDVTITGSSVAGSSTGIAISPTNPTVAVDGTITFSATGGTGTYTFVVLTPNGGSFNSNVYTAPPAAASVVVQVSDSNGDATQTVITVGSGSSTTTTSGAVSCEGSYAISAGNISGSMSIVEDSSGHIGGVLYWNSLGYWFPIEGTCTVSGSSGSISFSEIGLNPTISYTGTVSYNGSQVSLSGTTSTNTAWSASPQSTAGTIPAASQTCEGTYNATIYQNTGTINLVADGSSNVGGYLILNVPFSGNYYQYYYALYGTCTPGGAVSFTDETTGATYTGNAVVSGNSVNLSGQFTYQGAPYSWSASMQ